MSKTSLINMILASIGAAVGEKESRVVADVLVNVLGELNFNTSFLLSTLFDIRIMVNNNHDLDGVYIIDELIGEFR